MDTPTDTIADFSPRPANRIILTLAGSGARLYIPFEMMGPWSSVNGLGDGNAIVSYALGNEVFQEHVLETVDQINEQYERAMEVNQ